MAYKYRIDCWVPPKSGFDLSKKNRFIAMVESTMEGMKEDHPISDLCELQESFAKFKEEGEGYILDMVEIESDTPITSKEMCEEKVMPLIRQKNPLAKLVGCTEIPVEVK